MADEERNSLDDALIGRTIAGKFTIQSRIGGGGMGAVYRARQTGLDKIVAVKVLHRELQTEATFASRFQREATSTSRIDHPCCLRVLDFGEEPDGLLFIAMEYLEGKTLFSILRAEAPLAPQRIVDLSRQILAALAVAHNLGIVHRDLKPENVIVIPGKDDDGSLKERVKVCDFGIAKLQAKGEVDEKLTLEGSIVGTPEYLSPEQARGAELDARSDLYSMGVILFEMLTGEPPFRADTPLGVVFKHLDMEPPRPSSLVPSADPKLEAVCLKALSKAPADRYASAREMRAALSIANEGRHASTAPPPVRNSPAIVMSETPLPVSSTQAPVPLVARRPFDSSASHLRPRLSELSEPASGGASRVMALVVALALLGGGGGAYWMRKHATSDSSHTAAAREAPTVAPSSAAPPPTPESTPPAAETTPSPPPPAVTGLPPSELPVAASASAHTKHGHGAPTTAGAPSTATATVTISDTPQPPPTFAQDLGGTPPPPPAPTAKVSYSGVKATGVSTGSVTSALPTARFARCYHGASGSHARATIHLDLTPSTTKAQTGVDDTALAELASCVGNIANGITVSGTPMGGASADVELNFEAP